MSDDKRARLVEKMARSDAGFDGRPFDGLGRADKERYLARSSAALAIAERRFAKEIEKAFEKTANDMRPMLRSMMSRTEAVSIVRVNAGAARASIPEKNDD